MANEHDSTDPDGRLAGELAAFFARTDPVPNVVTESARAAIEFRDFDAQIAELLRDSALEDKELAGVRGIGQRLLTFGFGDRFLEVDITETAESCDLSGYLVPAGSGTVKLETPSGTTEAQADARGRFRIVRWPRGPVRLCVQVSGQSAFRTPWLTL